VSKSVESTHPIETGFFRLKFRRDRRSSLQRETVWSFYPKYLAESISKQIQWISFYLKCYRILRKVTSDPQRLDYKDLAITPVSENEVETLEMFQSAEAHAYVVKIQGLEKLRQQRTA
jgi:hypothetical protein